MAVGVLVFHERLSRMQRIAVALAVIAVVVLTITYGRFPVIALLLALSWSLYGWLKKQVPLSPLESMSAESFVVVVPAVIVVMLAAPAADSIPNTADGLHLVLIACTGIATVVPLMLFAWAAQRVPLTRLALLFGPAEYFGLMVLGLGLAVVLARGSVLKAIIAVADFAIAGQVGVSADVFGAAARLKLLHKWGVGVDNIDVAAATALGIAVARTTGANAVPVAEFTLGLTIAALRNLAVGHAELPERLDVRPERHRPEVVNGFERSSLGYWVSEAM
jgi:hypothetical protein